MNPILSITCTCIHGGGGHTESCAMFTPSREQYLEVRAERDKLRAVARSGLKLVEATDRFTAALPSYVIHNDVTDGLGKLRSSLDALNVSDGVTATLVRPWWFKHE